MTVCKECGQELVPRANEDQTNFLKRSYCSNKCRLDNFKRLTWNARQNRTT